MSPARPVTAAAQLVAAWLPLLLPLATSAGQVPEVVLSDGVRMPTMAFAAEVWHEDVCRNATLAALQAGFRFVWSSMLVGADCQRAQGEAMAQYGVKDLFVAGTVNTKGCKGEADCYRQTLAGAEGQLELLAASPLDMLMLDYPASADCGAVAGQWRALEEMRRRGKARTIAVSNFSPEQLQCLKERHTLAMPTVNQMPFSVGHGKDTVVADDQKFGIVVQAYSPLGTGQLARDDVCTRIGRSHQKSAVQVALRWILQHNVTIATQSTKLEHLVDDLDIFDFNLSEQEMAELDARTPSGDDMSILV